MTNNDKRQKTFNKIVTLAGVGLFTGEKTEIELCPASADSGLCFQRVDLDNKPSVMATLESVKETPLCTLIGNELATIQTVEHLLSALSAFQIDNALIRVKGPEIPVADGSAKAFVELIEKAGVTNLEKTKNVFKLTKPICWSNKEVHIIAFPSDEYRVSYTLHYPNSSFLRSQYFSFSVTPEEYKNEIAPSRTFSIYEEIEPLLQKRLIKGGGLDNAVIIKDEKIMNPEGTRFPEEMARHKILDLIGDLSLMGVFFIGHVVAIRSGHSSNIAFAKNLMKMVQGEAL